MDGPLALFNQVCSFICQVALARRQRSDLWVELLGLPVTTSLTTQR